MRVLVNPFCTQAPLYINVFQYSAVQNFQKTNIAYSLIRRKCRCQSYEKSDWLIESKNKVSLLL